MMTPDYTLGRLTIFRNGQHVGVLPTPEEWRQ